MLALLQDFHGTAFWKALGYQKLTWTQPSQHVALVRESPCSVRLALECVSSAIRPHYWGQSCAPGHDYAISDLFFFQIHANQLPGHEQASTLQLVVRHGEAKITQERAASDWNSLRQCSDFHSF